MYSAPNEMTNTIANTVIEYSECNHDIEYSTDMLLTDVNLRHV